MIPWDKIKTVQKMQNYISEYIASDNFDLNSMYLDIGYSRRHADRIFKELLGKTPRAYVKALIISNSSKELLHTDKTVLDIALNSYFGTHEGYTRAFHTAFKISPQNYRKTHKPIPLFIQYPIQSYYSYLYKQKELFMKKETSLCMITVADRPKRKLIFLRSRKATDYFSYCEEMNCDWEGLFNSISSKFDTAAIIELPKFLMKEGYSNVASGIEVPVEYDREIPDNCEIVELDPCQMLSFESEIIEKEEDFFTAIQDVFHAIDIYDPKKYGFEYDNEIAPRFNFGGDIGKTARYAIPIRKIKQ